MKTRSERNTEELGSMVSTRCSAVSPLLGRVLVCAVAAFGFLACTFWTDCSAYTPSDADLFNPHSVVPYPSLSDRREGPEAIGRRELPLAPGSRRGIVRALKRMRVRDIRKPAHEWSAPQGIPFGEAMPAPGVRAFGETRAVEQASREIGINGWSDDMRRYARLVFDREQRVLADQITQVPPGTDSIKGLTAAPPAPMLPGRLQWPELNAYEIWVAELLGL